MTTSSRSSEIELQQSFDGARIENPEEEDAGLPSQDSGHPVLLMLVGGGSANATLAPAFATQSFA